MYYTHKIKKEAITYKFGNDGNTIPTEVAFNGGGSGGGGGGGGNGGGSNGGDNGSNDSSDN